MHVRSKSPTNRRERTKQSSTRCSRRHYLPPISGRRSALFSTGRILSFLVALGSDFADHVALGQCRSSSLVRSPARSRGPIARPLRRTQVAGIRPDRDAREKKVDEPPKGQLVQREKDRAAACGNEWFREGQENHRRRPVLGPSWREFLDSCSTFWVNLPLCLLAPRIPVCSIFEQRGARGRSGPVWSGLVPLLDDPFLRALPIGNVFGGSSTWRPSPPPPLSLLRHFSS